MAALIVPLGARSEIAACIDSTGRSIFARHRMVGMTKSAPARMPVGQREVIVLSRV